MSIAESLVINKTSSLVDSFNPSPNANVRQLPVSMVVFHYTGMASGEAAIQRLTAASSSVSAHYLIDKAGHIIAMVDEDLRAWHAGVGMWRDITDVNSASIGIELVNPGHDFGYCPFPVPQMESLRKLCHDLMTRYAIPGWNFVGHSDIAPQRKKDPGELFPWKWLAENGIGIWPQDVGQPLNVSDVDQVLEKIGYDKNLIRTDRASVVIAFQRHFRPDLVNGILDEETLLVLGALLDLLPVD